MGVWQLKQYTEKERFHLRADGTFDLTIPIDQGRVSLAGEWDLDGRMVLLLYGEEKLSLTIGRVDAVTPHYLAFEFGGKKLMFDRVPLERSSGETKPPQIKPSEKPRP